MYHVFYCHHCCVRRGGGPVGRGGVYPRPNPLGGNHFPPAAYFNMFCGVRAGINPAPTASPSIPPCGGFVGTMSPSIPPCGGFVGTASPSIPPSGGFVGTASPSIPRDQGWHPVRCRGGVHPRPNPLGGNYHPPATYFNMFCGVRAGINPAPTVSPSIPPSGGSVGRASPSIPPSYPPRGSYLRIILSAFLPIQCHAGADVAVGGADTTVVIDVDADEGRSLRMTTRHTAPFAAATSGSMVPGASIREGKAIPQ